MRFDQGFDRIQTVDKWIWFWIWNYSAVEPHPYTAWKWLHSETGWFIGCLLTCYSCNWNGLCQVFPKKLVSFSTWIDHTRWARNTWAMAAIFILTMADIMDMVSCSLLSQTVRLNQCGDLYLIYEWIWCWIWNLVFSFQWAISSVCATEKA